MAIIATCLTFSKLFTKSLNPRVLYGVTRTAKTIQSDEYVDMLREFLNRKKTAGPEKPSHRSTFLEWNYKAELYAFSKRIGENFAGNSLERAFTQRSYVIQQESLQKELGLDSSLALVDNKELSEKGKTFSRNFISRYLRTALPCVPEESIQNIRDHLLNNDNLATIISNIGAEELILCTDFPAEKDTRASTLYAIVGAIEESSGPEQAALFVRDFVIASLSGQDLQSLVMPEKKLETLTQILIREGIQSPEARLIAQAGVNTITPSYRVALYSSKKYLGSGDGESVKEAQENAALSVLWKIWGIPDGKFEFPYRLDVSLALANSTTNVPQFEWTTDKAGLKGSIFV